MEEKPTHINCEKTDVIKEQKENKEQIKEQKKGVQKDLKERQNKKVCILKKYILESLLFFYRDLY